MPADGARIAFFESTTLLAKELRSVLESRAFPAGDVKLYDRAGAGAIGEFEGEALLVTQPDEDAILGLDIAFMCGGPLETAPYLDWPARKGYVAIDMSGASRDRPEVPLVHAEINPGDIALDRHIPPIIRAPHPISHNLASLVAAARFAGKIQTVEALALRPVSDMGERGIDELYQQTVGLLNLASVPQEVFGRQIAFNVLPSPGVARSLSEQLDERIREETARLLKMEPGQVSLASAFVPMFHGHVLATKLIFERPPESGAVESALRSARGVRVVDDPTSFSPVELAGEAAVAVLDLRSDPHWPARTSLWGFCDNLKGGAALNVARIAERVVDLRREAR